MATNPDRAKHEEIFDMLVAHNKKMLERGSPEACFHYLLFMESGARQFVATKEAAQEIVAEGGVTTIYNLDHAKGLQLDTKGTWNL